MDFIDDIKKELRPVDNVLIEIDQFIDKINLLLKKNNVKAVCVKGGSVAKGTFLKGDFDVDLFVKFDYSYQDKNISDILENILKTFNPERLHGSRDYFQIKDKLNYEVVPVLDVNNPEKALNVTDMSPMHVDWVKKNIKKGQDDEIRLAKKFCKSIGVYGAESYINGFSGHVLDILVIHYGSLIEMLKHAEKWQPPVVIDTEHHYKNKRDILFNINQSKIQGPLIIIDPLLKSRNAASALSYEKFALLKKRAKSFLKKPEKKYFEEIDIGKPYLKKKFKKNLFILTLKAEKGKRDVIGSKIVKALKFLKSELKRLGFKIKKAGWSWNEKSRVLFWFVFEEVLLPEKTVIEGPPLDMEEACKNFKQKYNSTFSKKGRIFSKLEIKKRKAEENIKEICAKDYFSEKLALLKTEKYI